MTVEELPILQQMEEEQMGNDKIEEANREMQEYHESPQYERDEEQFLDYEQQIGGGNVR